MVCILVHSIPVLKLMSSEKKWLLFSSAWPCQRTSWNQNLSVICLSVSQLSLNLMHGLLSNFGCCFPWAICWNFCWNFEKKKNGGGISFINMGPYQSKVSKRYSFYKSQPRLFKLLLNFLPNGPHKTAFGIFWKLKFWRILFIFVNMAPYGSENFKTLLL